MDKKKGYQYYLCIYWFLIFTNSTLMGQSQATVDSLKTSLQYATDLSTQVKILDHLAGQYYNYNADSILYYAEEVDSLARLDNNLAYKAKANHHRGTAYLFKSMYSQAIDLYREVISYYDAVGNSEKLMSAIYNTALCYADLGELDSTANYYFKALNYYTTKGDNESVANIYNGLAIAYTSLDQDEKAKRFYFQGLEKLGPAYDNKIDKANIYSNLSELYIKQNKLDSAKYYINKTIRINKLLDLKWGLGYSHAILSEIALLEKDHESSLEQAKISMSYRKLAGSPVEIGQSYLVMAMALESNDSIDTAKFYYLRAIKIFEENEYLEGLLESYKAISDFYQNQNDYKNSIVHLNTYHELKDEFNNQKHLETLDRLNIKYETAKKDILVQQQEIALNKQKRQKEILMISLLFILIVLVFLIYRNRKNTLIDKKEILRRQEEISKLEAIQKATVMNQVVREQFVERKQMAENLLDKLGAMLFNSRLKLHGIKDGSQVNLSLINDTEEIITDASQQVRLIAQDIMPEALINLGLAAAIEDLKDDLNDSQMTIETKLEFEETIFTDEQEIILYNVVRNALLSICKHNKSSEIHIAIIDNKRSLVIDLSYDGNPVSPDDPELTKARNQIFYLGGTEHSSIDQFRNNYLHFEHYHQKISEKTNS